MSIMQRLTLIGLYNYEQTFDRDLFSGLELPEHYDKSTFINALLLEHGEKCVLYSNPDFFKSAINMWSKKWALELSRIYEALTAEYNPIYNYDRYEDWTETDKPDNTITRTHNDTDTQTNNNTDTTTNRYDIVTEQNVDGFSENTISADNSSDYQPDNKNTSNAGKTTSSNDGTITDAHTGTIANAHTGTITDVEKGTRSDVTHSGHIQGNIGVTTSAQMVSEVVRQRFEINLYGVATKLFANELLIGIY